MLVQSPAEQSSIECSFGQLNFFNPTLDKTHSEFKDFFAAYWLIYHPSRSGSLSDIDLLDEWKMLFEGSHGYSVKLTLSALFELYRDFSLNAPFRESKSLVWPFFYKQVLSQWEQEENDQFLLFYKLFILIEEVLEEVNGELKKFGSVFPPFEEFLNKHTLADIEHFYALVIPLKGCSLYLLEILINGLEEREGWREQLTAVNQWIFAKIYSPAFKKSFDSLLTFELSGLSNDFTPEYIQKVEKVIKDRTEKTPFLDKIDNLHALFSLQWNEILPASWSLSHLKREYHSIWHYFLKLKESGWSQEGQIPPLILHKIFTIMKAQHRKDKKIIRYVHDLFEQLSLVSLKDLTFFFIQPFHYYNKAYYVGLAFIDYWTNPDNQQLKESLLLWLFKKNHSLVIKEISREGPYKPYFTLDYIKVLANQLISSKHSSSLSAKITKFIHSLNIKNKKEKLVEEIKALYLVFWDDQRGKQDILSESNPWVCLAQYLAGFGLIKRNYYRLMIPDCPNEDPISYELYIAHAPQFLIPSENGNELLLCENIRKYYDEYGQWSSGIRPLTVVEQGYFLDKYPQYKEKNAKSMMAAKPLTIDTIDLLLDLVNLSLFSSGFKAGSTYSSYESNTARAAFETFVQQLHRMEAEERENLFKQQIYYEGSTHSFETIWYRMVYKKECVVTNGRFLVSLILDYAPDAKFSEAIKKNMNLSYLQTKSARKNYREISALKALERLTMLVISLMTHSFSVSGGELIKFWDGQNTVSKTGSAIYKLILPILSLGNWESVSEVYKKIHDLVEEALNQRIFMTLTRTSDTHDWLSSIYNRSFYRAAENDCYTASMLMYVLWEEACNELKEKSNVFIEELIRTEIQSKNKILKKIRINIYFKKWLNGQTAIQKEILEKLTEIRKNKLDIVSLIINYLIDQIGNNIPLFFDEKAQVFKIDFVNDVPKKLEKNIIIKQKKFKFLNRLLEDLQEILQKAEKDYLVQTIQALLTPIPSSSTSLPDLRNFSDPSVEAEQFVIQKVTDCSNTFFPSESLVHNSGSGDGIRTENKFNQ